MNKWIEADILYVYIYACICKNFTYNVPTGMTELKKKVGDYEDNHSEHVLLLSQQDYEKQETIYLML